MFLAHPVHCLNNCC